MTDIEETKKALNKLSFIPNTPDVEKAKAREIYWRIKSNLKLIIDQRLKPKDYETTNIYQFLKLHGIGYEEDQPIE